MDMKKLSAAMAAVMILAGCSAGTSAPTAAPQPTPSPEATAEPTAAPAEEAKPELAANGEKEVLGGWTVNTSYNSYLTDDEIALFNKALEGLVGVGYTPVAILADQVVSGTNYAYLAMAKTVTADPKEYWAVVTVYQDLQGNAKIIGVKEIDTDNIKTIADAPESGLMGGWNVRQSGGKPVMMPDENAQEAADKILFQDDGSSLKPVVLLASQVVSGTNYRFLMRGNKEGDDATTLYVTTVYKNLDGNVEITDNSYFDLLSYVGPSN
ncbi:MAG: hypothetical protein IKD66_02100 [Solobacterium sp.]|nr:hypothetical protein [Solobacterium sp.]